MNKLQYLEILYEIRFTKSALIGTIWICNEKNYNISKYCINEILQYQVLIGTIIKKITIYNFIGN